MRGGEGGSLILVPLHGLGSDQVDKATMPDHKIGAYPYTTISQYSNFEFDEVLAMQLIIIISTKLINDK